VLQASGRSQTHRRIEIALKCRSERRRPIIAGRDDEKDGRHEGNEKYSTHAIPCQDIRGRPKWRLAVCLFGSTLFQKHEATSGHSSPVAELVNTLLTAAHNPPASSKELD
jgi:hypothetical protein